MKGVSWKDARDPACRRCSCTPCQCDPHVAKRAEAQEAYDARRDAKADTKKKSPQPSKPSKKQAKKTKAKFIKDLRKNNPSISDADLKKALKKAGYPVGCAFVGLLILASPLVWGAYEVVRAVI